MASSTRRKLVRTILVVALVPLAAEGYLRCFQPVHFMEPEALASDVWPRVHCRSDVPGLGYGLTPGSHLEIDEGYVVDVNSDGMRDEEVLPADTPGLFRIAVLGDSIAFGWKVAADECFTERLEEELGQAPAANGRVVEVLDFGVSGYSTRDEAILFRERVVQFDPDVLVVAYCLNDPEATAVQPLPRYFAETKLWQHSHFLRLLAEGLHVWRVKSLGHGDYYRYLHATDGEAWPTVLEAFDQIRDGAQERGIPVVVAIFPWMLEDSWDRYPFADLHAQVARAASERGFSVVDLLDGFRSHAPTEVVLSTDGDPHPTPLGHEIASQALARALLPLLGAAPSTDADAQTSGSSR